MLLAAAVAAASSVSVQAATIYWTGVSTDWNSLSNWSTSSDGATMPPAVPGPGDLAIFSVSGVSNTQTVNLNTAQAVSGIVGNNTAAVTLLGGGTNQTLSIDTSGISANGADIVIGSSTSGQNVAVSLTGSQTWSNTGTGVVNVVNGVSSGATDAVTLTLAGTSTSSNTIGGVISNGTSTVSLVKTGSNTWVLGGSNSYSGGTTISDGVLSISADAGLGASGSTLTLNGGTLATTASISKFSHAIATGTTGGTLKVASGTSLQINNYNANSATITGSGNITVTGGGLLILSGNNSSYTGNWLINAGKIEVQYNGTTSLGSGSVTLASGAELADDWGKTISNAIISNGGTISFAVSSGGVYSGPISLTSGTTTAGLRDFYSTSTARSGTISGVISGDGALATSGGGTVTLSGANTYTGGTTISNGTIAISSDANLGASSSAVTLTGGTLSVTASISKFSHAISTGTTGGTINVASAASLQINNYNANSAAITGSGTITVTGGGKLALSGNNSSYTGNWIVNAGTLEVQYNGSAGLGTGSVTLASGTELANDWGNTISNAITSNGGTLSFANYSGGTYSGAITLGTGTTTIGLRDYYTTSTARNGTISGVIKGTGALATSGGGSLILSGTNTYSGGTTIASGSVITKSASALGTGDVTLSGGTLSTGDTSVGSIAGIGNLTLTSGTLLLTVASNTSYDTLSGSGVLTLGGTIDLTGSTITDYNATYSIFNFSSVTGTSTITGYDTTDYVASIGSDGKLSFAAVPETGTLFLLGAGALSLLRQKKSCA